MSIVVKARICRQCGVEFQGGPRAWYCPSCRKKRSSEADARYKKNKRAGKTIIIGETIRKCEVCGEPFIMMAARQRYCKQCAPDAIKSVDNDQGREYMAAERANPERNEILKARKRFSSKKTAKEIGGVKMNTKIHDARVSAGLQIKQVADMLEAPYRTIQNWDLGNRNPPAWIEKIIIEKIQSIEKATGK